ncbi:phosphatidylserine synthase [Mesorhizobium sp.]|uniref:phosphatidylserine synthase n=1 Tax=Mesorhizobium sp. TaxID=1871066 RepID=UPI000FE4B62B|nr:phosphatidylserine synthase [Mesorhizobium sp.]RWD94259.1 MAG: phosphatidylserine synthase [Mesorhizobium sp.]TIV52681.1 MAG: phosphatidylserine synthase [Mesorhizobium sp.]
MKVLYIPLFRAPIGYTVSLGRRWTLLEHLILHDLASNKRTVVELGALANLPERLVVEALINLLRAGWVEMRSSPERAVFAATAVGRKRAAEKELVPELRREPKWASLCMDRITGSWMITEHLDLVYQSDLPEDAYLLTPILGTLNYDDPGVRDLIFLKPDEGFEGFVPASRSPSRPYARVVVSYGLIKRGLPSYASLKLQQEVLLAAQNVDDVEELSDTEQSIQFSSDIAPGDTLTYDNLIVGGEAHLQAVERALASAKSHVILHSCFLHPETVRRLLPSLEGAARRKVNVELLWGLRVDPEAREKLRPVGETEAVLDTLPASIRSRVQLSTISSGSHCKVLLHDVADGSWVSIVGSCNFLSSWYQSIDVSIMSASQRLASQILSHLLSAQLPPSGSWSAMARRMNRSWNHVRQAAAASAEHGTHSLILLADGDHYACVTRARDLAKKQITVGCDLFGLAAETSTLLPLERAAELGSQVNAYYQRPSKTLIEQGMRPDAQLLGRRGINLNQVDGLHGKFLLWDSDNAVVTSFNWLATVAAGSRSRGAELGILVSGPGIGEMLMQKLQSALSGPRVAASA